MVADLERTMATSAPTTELLCLLHQYEALRSEADDDLKSSLWNITKARRGRGYQGSAVGRNVEYTPEDVREEIRAQALLECSTIGHEPELFDEDVDTGASGADAGFVLHFDGMKGALLRRQQQQQQQSGDRSKDDAHGGLRRRKGKGSACESDGKCTEGDKERITEEILDEEEERLRNSDHLSLFGVPPPALRVAQTKSRGAVAYYVEVANLSRRMIEIMNK